MFSFRDNSVSEALKIDINWAKNIYNDPLEGYEHIICKKDIILMLPGREI